MSIKIAKWIEDSCSHMEAGTLVTGLRGPDQAAAPNTKKLVRWIRATTLINGNTENDFMQLPDTLPTAEEIQPELEYLSVHYFAHLIHALEIIGYKHPDDDTGDIAFDYYCRLVVGLHLTPESESVMTRRLSGEPGTAADNKPWIRRTRKEISEGRLCRDCLEFECICEELEELANTQPVPTPAPPVHVHSGRRGY
jgi:hypothetical protein